MKQRLPAGLKWLAKPFAWAESIQGGDSVASVEGQKALAGVDETRQGGISFQAPKSLAEIRVEERDYLNRMNPLKRDAHMNRPMQRTKTIFTGTDDPEQAQAFVDNYFKASGRKNAPDLAKAQDSFQFAADSAARILGMKGADVKPTSDPGTGELSAAARELKEAALMFKAAMDGERRPRPKPLRGNPVNSPQ
jgi:hypothetical protein